MLDNQFHNCKVTQSCVYRIIPANCYSLFLTRSLQNVLFAIRLAQGSTGSCCQQVHKNIPNLRQKKKQCVHLCPYFLTNTVKPVYKDHPRETKNVVFKSRWSL